MKGCGDAGMKPRESASPPSPAFIAIKLQGEADWLAKRVYGPSAHVTLSREGSNKNAGTAKWRATVCRRTGGGHTWSKIASERILVLDATKRALEFLIRNEARCTHCHRSLPLAYGGDKPCTARPKMRIQNAPCVP